MTYWDLINDPGVNEILRTRAPLSHYGGKPLTLVHAGDHSAFSYENSLDPEWWIGQQDGVYTHQIRRRVTEDEVESAAVAAGLDESAVRFACAQERNRVTEAIAKTDACWRGVDQADLERWRQLYAAADREEQGAILVDYEIQRQRLYGGRHKARRRKLRERFSAETPPETFPYAQPPSQP